MVRGVYIVTLTAIPNNSAIKIELGDNSVAKRVAIADALPISMTVFTSGAILGGQMFSAQAG